VLNENFPSLALICVAVYFSLNYIEPFLKDFYLFTRNGLTRNTLTSQASVKEILQEAGSCYRVAIPYINLANTPFKITFRGIHQN
jgi:hypothetical protein